MNRQKLDKKKLNKLLRKYASKTIEEARDAIYKDTGVKYSVSRIATLSRELKLYRKEGGFTINEAADLLGVARESLYEAVMRGKWKTRKRGMFRIICQDEFERMEAHYINPPPKDWVKAKEAAEMLGYNSLTRPITAGNLTGKKFRSPEGYVVWYIPEWEIREIKKILASGQTKIKWFEKKWQNRLKGPQPKLPLEGI